MKLGKALSFISPVMGMATGQGIGKVMPYLSPAYGMLSGKGPFAFGQKQGLQPGEEISVTGLPGMAEAAQAPQPQSPPTGMFGAMKPGWGNAISAGLSGFMQGQQGGGQQMGMNPMMLRHMMMQRGRY